jgi:YebC/PmpR family DNA-binding regulatory protein
MFTKLGREISVATRQGGPDPQMNARLRLAIERARAGNMPLDTIERAIKRAAGAGGEGSLDEISYEGYGPGGAALLIAVLTDNRNRSVADVRSVFTRAGGNLAEAGAVAWQFQQRGVVTIEANDQDPDEVGLWALDAGADDARVEGELIEVYTEPSAIESVHKALEEKSVKVVSAEVAMVPSTMISLEPQQAAQTLRLMEKLEDLDDVQKVYTNLEITDEALAAYGER